jgi:hypothetical protein
LPTTPRLALPYPRLADSPDVPRDFQQLAIAIEAASIGWVVGDFKFSFQTVDHTGFVLCDGIARLRASLPIPYTSLIDSVMTPHPDPTRVRTPNFKRNSPMGADPGGAAIAGVVPNLGAIAGEQSHLLLASEAALKAHGHANTFDIQPAQQIYQNRDSSADVNNWPSTPWFTTPGTQFEYRIDHDHALSGSVSDAAGANASTPHNIVQPVVFVNAFIATSGGGVGSGAAPSGTPHGVGGAVHLPAGVRTNVTHNLGTALVSVTTWDVASGEQVDAGTEIETINIISLFSSIDTDVNAVIVPVGGPLPPP